MNFSITWQLLRYHWPEDLVVLQEVVDAKACCHDASEHEKLVFQGESGLFRVAKAILTPESVLYVNLKGG